MKSIQSLAAALLEEMDETSDVNPVVTVDRRKLRALLELIAKQPRKYTDDDE